MNPLVSLLLLTYNQESIVETAVMSAFEQNYSPLEIILSDDCSTDGTFDALQKMADEYDGPHKVRVNRNVSNLGIGKHWDTISRQAMGDLIIHAAGDDISVPSRVTVLLKAWKSVEPQPSMISSDGMIMTFDEGKPVRRHIGSRWPEEVLIQRKPREYDLDSLDVPVSGFSLAIDRRLYEVFEPIQDRLWAEDVMLRRRALLLQGIMYIPDVLVFYRDQGLSKGAKKNQQAYLELYIAQAETRLSMVYQSMRDIDTVSPLEAHAYLRKLQCQEKSAKRRLRLIHGDLLTSAVMLFCQIAGKREFGINRKEYLSLFIVKWAPKFFFWARNMKIKVMKMSKFAVR
ncbi:MAG: glycosyltransferase [Spirochaetales bacterium]|nr:glycosyltransferase [Spirochaetales bacterium]